MALQMSKGELCWNVWHARSWRLLKVMKTSCIMGTCRFGDSLHCVGRMLRKLWELRPSLPKGISFVGMNLWNEQPKMVMTSVPLKPLWTLASQAQELALPILKETLLPFGAVSINLWSPRLNVRWMVSWLESRKRLVDLTRRRLCAKQPAKFGLLGSIGLASVATKENSQIGKEQVPRQRRDLVQRSIFCLSSGH